MNNKFLSVKSKKPQINSKDLAIVCFLWDNPKFRSQYSEIHVEMLSYMVERNWSETSDLNSPTFYCITNKKRKFKSPHIKQIVFDMNDFSHLKNIGSWPVLKIFDPLIQSQIKQPLILKLDLDLVLIKGLKDLIDRELKSNFLTGWLDPTHKILNCSFLLFENKRFNDFWNGFKDPINASVITKLEESGLADKFGWDQCWINFYESKTNKHSRFKFLTKEEGLFHRREIEEKVYFPKNAKIVFFPSSWKPWHDKMQHRHGWIKNYYKINFL